MRRFRQNLDPEVKTGKYFKYAIGEIVLVVIGILIALQINNWNEKNKIQKQKSEVLSSLNNEFKKNLSELTKTMARNEQIINASKKLLNELYNSELEEFKGEKLDSLLSIISDIAIWKRSDFNIDVIQNSNIFDHSEDSELMELVFEWEAQTLVTENLEEKATNAFHYYVDFIKKNGSWREIDKYILENVQGSSLLSSNDHLLLEPEFENCLNDIFIWNTHKTDKYKKIRIVVENIIDYTNDK